MEFGSGLPRQSALMLAARITLPHFSVSSAMNLPKSAGEPANTAPPRSVRPFLMLGSPLARMQTQAVLLRQRLARTASRAATPPQRWEPMRWLERLAQLQLEPAKA